MFPFSNNNRNNGNFFDSLFSDNFLGNMVDQLLSSDIVSYYAKICKCFIVRFLGQLKRYNKAVNSLNCQSEVRIFVLNF